MSVCVFVCVSVSLVLLSQQPRNLEPWNLKFGQSRDKSSSICPKQRKIRYDVTKMAGEGDVTKPSKAYTFWQNCVIFDNNISLQKVN